MREYMYNQLDNLKKILKDEFPEEKVTPLAKILLVASDKGEISYQEIKALGGKEEEIFLAYYERLLIPTRTLEPSKSLAWENRIVISKKGEKFEMPNVIRYLVKDAAKKGIWRPDYAVQNYLRDIEEPENEEILELFQQVKRKIIRSKVLSKTKKVTPWLLKEAAKELKLELDIDKTIAELKGRGIISPSLRNFRYKLLYEINPSLFQRNKTHCMSFLH